MAEPAGFEDARAYFQCPTCARVWATHISLADPSPGTLVSAAPRVLIAEDSPEMLGLLAAWLEDEQCVVIGATSGRQAIDLTVAHQPQIAFVDVVLPPPDGFFVCQALTQRFDVTTVLMTGMARPDPVRASESGALLMLRKPLSHETVIDALTLALEQCRRKGAAGGTALAV